MKVSTKPLRLLLLVGLTLSLPGCLFGSDDEPALDGDPDESFVPSDSQNRERLTFLEAPLTEDLLDFPVLVVLYPDRFNYSAALPNGEDIRFIDQDGNVLPYEIELWNPDGNSYLWVKTKAIRVSGDNFIDLYYGFDDATPVASSVAVWGDDYTAVWHLAEDVADGAVGEGVHLDATGRGNHGAQNGNAAIDDSVGAIGRAQSFAGTLQAPDYIEIAPNSMQLDGTEVTISARVFVNNPTSMFPHVFGAGSGGQHWQLWWRPAENGWGARYRVAGAGAPIFTEDTDRVQTWTNLTLVYDGSAVRLFVNGSQVDEIPAQGILDPIDSPLRLGDNSGIADRFFNGYIDEVRVAPTARSAEWLDFQHRSLNDSLLSFEAPAN